MPRRRLDVRGNRRGPKPSRRVDLTDELLRQAERRPREYTLFDRDRGFSARVRETGSITLSYRPHPAFGRPHRVLLGRFPIISVAEARAKIDLMNRALENDGAETPKPRSQVWRSGEVARLVKNAIRSGYTGLACIISVAWDTQFSPVDARKLTIDNLREHGGALFFEAVRREKTGKAIIGTLSKPTARLVRAYLSSREHDALTDEPIFRHRKGRPYSKDTLGDDFRSVRAIAFPGDERVLMDMRRSGAVEAAAGEVDMNSLAAKMGNTINSSRQLQATYQPVDLAAVRNADEARIRGRQRIRNAGKA